MEKLLRRMDKVIVIGSIPFIMFWLAIIISFIFFPNDIDNAIYTILTSALMGALVSILIILNDLKPLLKKTIISIKKLYKDI